MVLWIFNSFELLIGAEIDLEPEAEEAATFFAGILGTDYANNPTFCKNFFDDFTEILKKWNKVDLFYFFKHSLYRKHPLNLSINVILHLSLSTWKN